MNASKTLWQDAWQRLRVNKAAVFSAGILLLMIFGCFVVPLFLGLSFEQQNLDLGASSPSLSHWFGTDPLGRDLFVRILHGGRISILVGLIATIVSLVIGVIWGAIAGYFGGRVDALMMRIVDILFALPFVIFVILLMVVFGRHLVLLFLAIGAIEWLTMARIVRGQVSDLKNQDFVLAARTMGFSKKRIIFKHMIPNVLGPVIVYTTLTIPNVMLLEAFLSFLGLGVQAPMSSWGLLISTGVETMEEYPWLLIFPGLFLAITLFCLNFLGDGLRDALDPKASRKLS